MVPKYTVSLVGFVFEDYHEEAENESDAIGQARERMIDHLNTSTNDDFKVEVVPSYVEVDE